jgi:hypothetical protein
MISARFALPVLALLCLALVPTVTHAYLRVNVDDGQDAAAVGWTLADLQGVATERSPAWVREHYDSDNWIERQFISEKANITVFIARSFDFKRLYHHPENAVLHGHAFESRGTRRLPRMPNIPVRVLESASPGAGLAVYALLYDGTFVDNPYLFQVRSSWDLLLGGRKQMTLFLVHDPSNAPDVPVENSLAVRVLDEAIQQFLAQPPSKAM